MTKPLPPGVKKAQHRIVKSEPTSRPQPKPGFRPQGGAHASTIVSDQQQQLQDKGGA